MLYPAELRAHYQVINALLITKFGRGREITPGSCRYKLPPVIFPSGWLSPFNFAPGKISHPSGHQLKPLMFKIAPGDFVFRAPALYPSGHQLKPLMFKIAPGDFVELFRSNLSPWSALNCYAIFQSPIHRNQFYYLVGVERFELPTSCSQSRRATRLRYTP